MNALLAEGSPQVIGLIDSLLYVERELRPLVEQGDAPHAVELAYREASNQLGLLASELSIRAEDEERP